MTIKIIDKIDISIYDNIINDLPIKKINNKPTVTIKDERFQYNNIYGNSYGGIYSYSFNMYPENREPTGSIIINEMQYNIY
jgi:hypothetical protein